MLIFGISSRFLFFFFFWPRDPSRVGFRPTIRRLSFVIRKEFQQYERAIG